MSCLRLSDIRHPTSHILPRSAILLIASCAFLFSLPAFAGPPGAVGDIYCASGESIKQFDGVTLDLVGVFSEDADVGGSPKGLAFGANGNIFGTGGFTGNQVIELNGTSGDFVGVFADVGSGTGPWGLTFGPNGNLYVACHSTDDVREFDGASGAFIGVFSSGDGLDNPFALAFGGPSGNLFVTSQAHAPDSGSPGVPGDVLEFDGVTGAFVGVFAAEVAPDVCPSPPCEYNSFSSIVSLAFGPNGNLFVGVGNNSVSQGAKIIELDGASGAVVQEFGQDLVSHPRGLAFGPGGHLFVAEVSDRDLLEFDVTTGGLVNSVFVLEPWALTFKPPCPPITPVLGGLLPTQADNCGVLFGAELTGTGLAPGCVDVRLTKAGEPDVVGIISGGVALGSIEVDFLLDGDAAGLWDLQVTYPADGQFDTLAGAIELVQTQACPAPLATGFAPDLVVNCSTLFDAEISGIGFLPSYTFGAEVVLVKAGESDIVGTNVVVESDTLITADFDLTSTAAGLWDVVVTAPDGTHGTTLVGGLEIAACIIGAEGDLYVGIWGAGGCGGGADSKVMQFDVRTGQVVGDLVPSEAFGIDYPMGITFGGPDDNLFLADWPGGAAHHGRIIEFDGVTGDGIGIVASWQDQPEVAYLRGLTFGPNGHLFVSTQLSATVLEFDAATGTPLGAFAQMITGQQFYDLTFGPNGNLFVIVSDPHSVQEFDGASGALVGTFVTFDGTNGVNLIFGGPHGNLFVTTVPISGTSRILEYNGATGALIGEFAEFGGKLRGLAFGPNGNLFVAFQVGAAVRGIREYDPSTGDLVGISEIPCKPAFVTVKPFSGTFPQPVLTIVTPAQPQNCGVVGATVTGADLIWGASFKLARTGEADIVASSLTFVSSTEVTLNLDLTAATLGHWDLAITYPDGKTATLADAIDVALCVPPVVDSLTPSQVDSCAALVGATVSGTGFLAGSTVMLSQSGEADIAATNLDVQSDSTIIADFDVTMAAPGAWDLEVIHPGGSNSGSLAGALDLLACPPPVVTDFSPLQAQNCNWLIGAQITGEWFTPGMSVVLSMPGEQDIPGTNVDVQSAATTELNFNLTGASPGSWDLTVTRPDQESADFAAAVEVLACDPKCRPFGNPEFAAGYAPEDVVFGDLDSDGDLDLVLTTRVLDGSGGTVSVLLSDGDGTFATPVEYMIGPRVRRLAIGDLDGDGDLDLAVAVIGGSGNTSSESNDEEVAILFNTGDGTFGGLAFYPVAGRVPEGIAMGDLDGDGDLDLAVAHRTPHGVHVLLNNGDGIFTLGADNPWSGSSFAHGVEVGDVDGDDDLDLAIGSSNGLRILLNNGDATFGPVSVYYAGAATPDANVAMGDLDGDGDLDVVLNVLSQDAVAVFYNDGGGGYGSSVMYPVGIGPNGPGPGGAPRDVALGDLEGDGDLDLVVANDVDRNVSVLMNDGNGSFADQVMYEASIAAWAVAIAPVDGDEALDIVIANRDSRTISLLTNNGDGTFHSDVRYRAGEKSCFVQAADLDGDGALDLAVANYGSDDISVLLNDGDGTYGSPIDFSVGGNPSSVASGDWDGDGNLDLAVTNSIAGDDDLSILLGNGDGTFAPEVRVAVGGFKPWQVASADLDADGTIDLVTANRDSSDVSILLGAGDGTFSAPLVYDVTNARAVAIADLDGDGDPDLAIGRGSDVEVLLNNGDATFASAGAFGVDYAPFSLNSIASADLDGDGDFDLVLAGSGSTAGFLTEGVIAVLLNNGDATFSNPVTEVRDTWTGWVAIEDMDADGVLDLIVVDGGNAVLVSRGHGDGTFAFSTALRYGVGDQAQGLATGDLDGDGRIDAAVANCGGGLEVPKPGVSVLLNRGCGVFQPCPADFDDSGAVSASDLATLLGAWGPCAGQCPADLDDNGAVGAFDLALLLGNWGPCPACGDGQCGASETCLNCEADCGACPIICGDGVCNGNEGCTNCELDCGVCACGIPGTGNCCAATGTPFCDDTVCCNSVCAVAAICCEEGWDSLCAGLAQDICTVCGP